MVADVLQRHVDVAGDFGRFGNGLDEIIAPMRRVRVEQANPEDALDLVQLTDERGKRLALAGINATARLRALLGPLVHAEVGGVLGDEIDLLHAAGDELTCFLDDALLRAAAMAATNARDDAEGARVVAAFGDLDVGHVLRREAEARCVVVRDVLRLAGDEVFLLVLLGSHELLNNRGHLGDLIQTYEGIHFRHQTGQFLRKTL